MQTNPRHIRQTTQADYTVVRNLISRAYWLHQHLDWVDSLSLLERSPFIVALRMDEAVGCLVCPPDPPTVAWIRLFAVSEAFSPGELWEQLWPAAVDRAVFAGVTHAAALLTVKWFAPLLEASGFVKTNDVIFLEWMGEEVRKSALPTGKLRAIHKSDLPQIALIDQSAFDNIWQYSKETLIAAFEQAAHATLIEVDRRPIAYQMTTASTFGAHLARLAVDPDWQGHGYGKALVHDVQQNYSMRGNVRVSVNTQLDNYRSLHIYEQLGFHRTDATYPVYEIQLA